MPSALEQAGGFLLLALVLLDVFLDVLYARLGTGILAPRISQLIWRGFLWMSRPMGRHRPVAVLSLTLTYLMQIYSALQRRSALGLRYVALRAEWDAAVGQLASAL